MVFEVLCGTCRGGILILRQRNLGSVCPDFSVSILRFFTVCAVNRFQNGNTKLDHAELLSFSVGTLPVLLIGGGGGLWGSGIAKLYHTRGFE